MTDRSAVQRPAEDLLVAGSERDPWRPSRRQRAALAGALLVAAGVVAGGAAGQHRADQRRAQIRALAAVALAATGPPEGTPWASDAAALGLRNDSARPVQVLSVQVAYPGYRRVAVRRQLRPYETAAVRVPTTPRCDGRLGDEGPSRLLVEVGSRHGVHRRLSLPLLDGGSAGILGVAARERCGLDVLPQALQVDTSARVDVVAAEPAVDLRIRNLSEGPVEVLGVDSPGLVVRPDRGLPLVVPGRGASRADRPPSLRVHLRLLDCKRAAAWLLPGRALEVPLTFRLSLGRGNSQASVYAGIEGGLSQEAAGQLLDRCGLPW